LGGINQLWERTKRWGGKVDLGDTTEEKKNGVIKTLMKEGKGGLLECLELQAHKKTP